MKTSLLLLIVAGFLIQGSCNRDKEEPRTKANFSVSGYEVAVPNTISFINTSVNASSYAWDFGDGQISTESNPTHQYSAIGTYILRLKATGATGVDSVCKLLTLDKVIVGKSTFSYFFDRCSGYPVGASFKTLNPASTNTVWDFGNGVVNISRDPIVQFVLPGDYTIKYSSLVNGVRDTVTRIIQIQ